MNTKLENAMFAPCLPSDSLDKTYECGECGAEHDDEDDAEECCAPEVFTYGVDLDERGEFRAHVDNPMGKTVYELHADGEELQEVVDGFMKHKGDTDGLKAHLIEIGIMPAGAVLEVEA